MYISVEIFCCYVYHSKLQMGHSELENGTSKSESIPKCNWGTPVRVAHLHFRRAGLQVGIDSDLRLQTLKFQWPHHLIVAVLPHIRISQD